MIFIIFPYLHHNAPINVKREGVRWGQAWGGDTDLILFFKKTVKFPTLKTTCFSKSIKILHPLASSGCCTPQTSPPWGHHVQ